MRKIALLLLVLPSVTLAQGYVSLSGLPGLSEATQTTSLSDLINVLYQYSIAIGVLLAVFLIIYYGAQYMTTDIVGKKVNLRTNLTNVIAGLVVILSAYIVLNFINPQLTTLQTDPLAETDFSAPDYVATQVIERGTFAADGEFDSTSDYEGQGPYIDSNVSADINAGVEVDLDNTGSVQNTVGDTVFTSSNTFKPPTVSGGITVVPKGHKYYNTTLNSLIADELGTVSNPWRKISDFASKGNGEVRMSQVAIAADKYIQDNFYQRFGKIIPIVSAYRDPAHNASVGGAKGNHPYGYSIDYSTKNLSNVELVFLQKLALDTGVKRVGFGRSNDAGTHLQWDYGRGDLYSGTRVYWCYPGTPGPFAGAGSMPGFIASSNQYKCQY